MQYDFDTVLDRRETHSLKWDRCLVEFGLDDVIPMWVADMDFAAPPAVVEAVTAARRAWRLRLRVGARVDLGVRHRLAADAPRVDGRAARGSRARPASCRR